MMRTTVFDVLLLSSLMIAFSVSDHAPGHHRVQQCHVQQRGVDARAKREILFVQNGIRSETALGRNGYLPFPYFGVANMEKLTWSPKLAEEAQKRADNCDHSFCSGPACGEL